MDFPLSYKFGVSICIQLFILGLASSPNRIDNVGLDQEAGVLRKYMKNGLRVAGRNAGVLNQGFPYDGVFWRFIRKLIEREKTGQTPIKKCVPLSETKRAEVAVTERIEELEEALKTVQSIQEEINMELLDRASNRGWVNWCPWCDRSKAIKNWDIVFRCRCPKEADARVDLDSENK